MTLKQLLNKAAAALATALAPALALAAAPVAAHEVETAPVATPGPALWQVADEDTTIYLFGTVHVLPDGIDWYDARIERAFTSSADFVTEIITPDQAAAQSIAGRAMLDGTTLRELMNEEDRQEFEDALVTLGLPVEALDPVEPWFATMNLSMLPLMRAGYNPASGVELSLEARAEGKTRGALETLEQQIALFDTLPMDAQLLLLDRTVEGMPESVAMIDTMVQHWLAGDAVALADMLNSEMDDPALYQRLLVDRNANWAEWIERRLAEPGEVFIAVGAGHLAGRGSVQDLLADRGIEVTRITD